MRERRETVFLVSEDIIFKTVKFLRYLRFIIRFLEKSTATGYGLDGPGIEFRWVRDFPHLSRPALGPTQPPVQWVPGLSRGKEQPGCDADPSPLLVPWSRKGRAIPLLPL